MALNMNKIENKIDEIDECLQTTIDTEFEENANINLLAGKQGITLFLFLNSFRSSSSINIDNIEKLIASGFNSINSTAISPNFCSGLSGFLFSLQFFEKNKIISLDQIIGSYKEILDSYLNNTYIGYLKRKNYDFLHEAEGILYYFINGNVTEEQIDFYLQGLDKTKIEIKNKGVAWKSNISLQDGNKLVFNLGLAHGMASTITLLSEITLLNIVVR